MQKYLVVAVIGAGALFFSGAASASDAVAYCWFNQHDYYRCYGPTQLTLGGEKDIAKPLELSGCRGALRQTDFTRAGVGGGAWFTCQRKLEGYHNDSKKIGAWLSRQ